MEASQANAPPAYLSLGLPELRARARRRAVDGLARCAVCARACLVDAAEYRGLERRLTRDECEAAVLTARSEGLRRGLPERYSRFVCQDGDLTVLLVEHP